MRNILRVAALIAAIHTLPEAGTWKEGKPTPEESRAEADRLADSIGRAEKAELARKLDFTGRIAFPGDSSDCVAYDKAGGECVLAAAEFNRRVADCIPPDGWDAADRKQREAWIHETRESLAHGLAGEKFILTKLRDPGLRAKVDAETDQTLRDLNQARRRAFGDSALRTLYAGRLAPIFKERTENSYRIIASTDSLFIDSIFRIVKGSRSTDRNQLPAGRIPWHACNGECEALAGTLRWDSVSQGDWIGPIRFPFAWAMIQLSGKRTVPGLSYEAAIPYLHAMGPSLAWLRKPTRSEIRKEFEANRIRYEKPDTIIAKAWLAPPAAARSAKAAGDVRAPGKGASLDTSRFRPLMLALTSLPDSLRRTVESRMDKQGYFSATLEFGAWVFRTQELRRAKTGASLADVEEKIGNELEIRAFDLFAEQARLTVAAESESVRKRVLIGMLKKEQGLTFENLAREKEAWLGKDIKLLGVSR
jgi:hypothetical protein